MRTLPLIAGTFLSLAPLMAAASTELITNGDFEAGLTGWTCSDADACGTDTFMGVFAGAASWYGFDNNGFATLSQSIATNVGATYDVSFWYQWAEPDVYEGNISTVDVGGTLLENLSNTTLSWTQVFASFVADAAVSTLTFTFETDPGTGTLNLDNVSVMEQMAPVPLPASALLLGGAIAGLGVMRRRRARA